MLLSQQPAKKDLWLRLKRYHFDNLVPPHLMDHVTAAFGGSDPSTKAFASKLARKLGWKSGFALQAIEEYRKFVYLGVVSDFAVTPPKIIDQVWHEHLLFSRAYREFCAGVLLREFDHNPELVPTDTQRGVFSAQYEATLNLYALEFNVEPPQDIWGKPKFTYALVPRKKQKPRKKDDSYDAGSSGGDSPLYLLFDGSDGHGSADGMSEFGGGGGFMGGGGGDSWGGADSSSAGGDSGSDSGGSGCSSGCGGGCGGE